MKSLKQLAKERVKFAVIAINETQYWNKDIADKAKRIDGIYLVNLTEPTHLCSFEINYPAEQLKNYFHNIDNFDTDSHEFYELENIEGSDNYPYFLETDTFEIKKEYFDGEYEEVLENERCNPAVC